MMHNQQVSTYTQQATTVPDDAILGHVLWFTVSNVDVSISKAQASIASNGLSGAHLRTQMRPVDAFRKATKEIEKRFPKNDQGFRSNFLVRPVGQDPDTAHRHVVLERARAEKGKKRRLLYTTVAEIVFHRGVKKDGAYSGYRVEIVEKEVTTQMTTQEEDWLSIHLKNFQSRFRHHMNHLDGNAIRQFVRDTIYREMLGVCIKESGGVYFVQHKHKSLLDGLNSFVNDVGSTFHDLPLVDLDEQREMVLAAYQDETVADLRRATEDLADILRDPNRTIRSNTFNEKKQFAAEVLTKAAEMEALLDRKASLVHQEVAIYKQQLLSLTSRVE